MPSAPRNTKIGSAQLDATERLVVDVFRQVLERPNVPDDVDFLSLGGDSLQATRAVTLIAALCNVQLPLRKLFEGATVASVAAAIRAAQSAERVDAVGAAKRRGRPSSLSFSQERMWFMHALASASAAYHVPLALRLRGPLDVRALQRALDRVVQRHETLRTTFVGYSSGVSARVAAAARVYIGEVSFQHPHESTDLERVRTYLSEFANGTFDLDQGPLLRAVLVHVASNDAVLLLLAHHIVADQWALDVLMRELAGFYAQELGGPEYAPPALTKSYAEYAQWHRTHFESRRRNLEIAYWKQKLAGLEPTVLNADHPRPPQQSFRGAKLRLDFAADEIDALTRFGAAHRSTLALVLLTALKVLLHRHTHLTDIAVGVPIANRHHADAEPLIGTLVNTLVLRTDLGGHPTFTEALGRVRATALEAFEHQDTPFEAIVKELQIPRDASRSPLFSVLFNMLNTPLGSVRFEGLEWSRFDFDKKAAQFDLTVTIDAQHDRSISFEYSQDLFTPATIARLADHYRRLLRAVLATPHAAIASMSMLGDEERNLIMHWANGRAQPLPRTSIVDLLRDTCARRPGSIALTIDDHAFTYRELDEASDRIAAALHDRGVARGMRVGLCLHRSAQLVIAQWAALKCGAAYVPLDPSYPRERLTFMASDARLAILITEPSLAQELGSSNSLGPLLDIDAELARGTTRPLPPIDPPRLEDAAYVIYTSGSTGQPKGVVVNHQALANFAHSMAVEPGLTPADRVLAITTLSFDIAALELLVPWSIGAHVFMVTQDQVADAEALRRLIATHQITLMQATPSTWRMLIDGGWEGSPRLRALVGGEPLPRELASHLLARCAELWNMYGPTETTVWSTCWKVTAPESNGISLGRPIANTQVYVLNEARELCAIGVPGEICIGGAGLADGYFDRPELTNERFIANPLAGHEAERLYRTGDRGRWRYDGALEHLGRLDTQVKVRGHRIELGEIESHLVQHPAVRRALVTTHESRGGDVRLIAYIVAAEAMPEAAALRSFLRERLPDYMLPQWFVALESIPTLPNGKTDLKRLPAPQQDSPTTAGEPRTEMEKALCAIWQEILQIERVGLHDNFFDLGGHSILTVRLVARIRVDLRRACTLPMIFRFPTIATLAAALEGASPLEGSSLIPLQPQGVDPPLFCICGVQIYQELANRLGPDVPVYGVFVPLELEYVIPKQKGAELPPVEQLASEYLRTIRGRQPHGPYRLLGFSFGGVLAYEMAQQLRAQGETVSFLAILDSDVPERRRRARSGRLEQRLSILKQRLGRRLKGPIQRFMSGAPSLAEARDDRYLAAMRSYAASPYEGPAIYVQAIDAAEYNPGYGWDALVAQLHIYRIPGDHLGILSPPNVDQLAAKLRLHLEK